VEIMRVLQGLARGGLTVVAAVHDLQLAAAYCDRVAVLAAGRLVASGPPAAVITDELVATAYGPPAAERWRHLRTAPPA
jgi:iron complex transport system ATP-binding protein